MLWVAAMMLLVAMCLPLRLQADLHRGQHRLLRLQVDAPLIRRVWLIESRLTPQGRQIVATDGRSGPRELSVPAGRRQAMQRMLRLLRRSPAIRRFLLRHVHPLQLDVQLLLHTRSAAATALATGGLQTLLASLPSRWYRTARLRILPDFLRDHSTLQARCIFTARLGTLLITSGLLLSLWIAQAINREAQRIWNIPSEN